MDFQDIIETKFKRMQQWFPITTVICAEVPFFLSAICIGAIVLHQLFIPVSNASSSNKYQHQNEESLLDGPVIYNQPGEKAIHLILVEKQIQQLHLYRYNGAKLKVSGVMHIPERSEYIDETETLEKAMALYVMGIHQPLIVKNGDDVTGVLRFGDVFEVIRHSLLSCAR